jgi:hypothetical protein
MADYGVNATQLTEAQGKGTQPLAPVEERVTNTGTGAMAGVLSGLAEEWGKSVKANAKADAEARKTAVVGEYLNNQKVFDDALISGQWNASQVSTASRANFSKMLTAYPQYVSELTEARRAAFTGMETGEAQRKVDAENKQFEQDVSDASKLGYTFYAGQSDEAKMANVNAWKEARRAEHQYTEARKKVEDGYADNAEARAAGTYNRDVADYVAKEQAFDGTRTVAATNFDAVQATATDLIGQVASGKMSYDVALQQHNLGIQRVKAGVKAIAGKFPEAASMWDSLFSDMDSTVQKLLDPTKKSENETKMLRDHFEKLKLTAQIAAVERDPELLKTVAASDLFRNEPILRLVQEAPVKRWLMSSTGVDPALQSAPVVGTANDAKVFSTVTKVLQTVQGANIPAESKAKTQQEALNMVNKLLQETSGLNGEIPPSTLKEASKFFASPEFGRLSLEGKLDAQTAANAQHVFQTKYEPAVRTAIISKLESAVSVSGEPLLGSVNIKVVGGKVVFEDKTVAPMSKEGGIGGWIDSGLRGHKINAGRQDVKAAEDGLNQLIRLHAHLEGTTDYANYWDKNKHQLMPSIFPDPNRLKPGQVVDGFKYTGGNYRDRNNWIAEPTKPAK